MLNSNISWTDFPMSNLLKKLIAEATKLSVETGSKWVTVQHLFAAMIYAVYESSDRADEELCDLKTILKKECYDIERCYKVSKHIFSTPIENTFDDIESWHEVLLYSQTICEETHGECICADMVFRSIVENLKYKNPYVRNILNQDYHLPSESCEQTIDELKKKKEFIEEQLYAISQVLPDIFNEDDSFFDDEYIDDQECFFDQEEELSLSFEKEFLINTLSYNFDAIKYDSPEVFSGIVEAFNAMDPFVIFEDTTRNPICFFLVGGSKRESDSINKFLKEMTDLTVWHCFHTVLDLDMKNYTSANSVKMLCGSKDDNLPLPGFLTQLVKENPRSILHFKNIEFAAPEVQELLLELINKGSLTDEYFSQEVSFNQTIVFLEAGTQELWYKTTDDIVYAGVTKDEIFDIAIKTSEKACSLEKFRKSFADDRVFIFNKRGFESRVNELKFSITAFCHRMGFSVDSSIPGMNFTAAVAFSYKQQSKIYFINELLEYFDTCKDICGPDRKPMKLDFILDLPNDDERITSLFAEDEKKIVFLFSSKHVFDEMFFEDPFLKNKEKCLDKDDIIHFSDYNKALNWLENNSPDVIIIDLNYRLRGPQSRINCLEDIKTASTKLLQRLREKDNQIPVYILTSTLEFSDNSYKTFAMELYQKSTKFGFKAALPVYLRNGKDWLKMLKLKKSAEWLKNEGLFLEHKLEFNLCKDENTLEIKLTDFQLKKL